MKKKPITKKRKAKGFASEDDWFEYQLENDPRFLARIEAARQSLRQGHGVRLEDLAVSPQRPLPRAGKKRPR